MYAQPSAAEHGIILFPSYLLDPFVTFVCSFHFFLQTFLHFEHEESHLS